MSPSRTRNAIRVTGIPAWLALVVAGYRLFLIFAASSVCASANVRTIADANAAAGVGWETDGFCGLTTVRNVSNITRQRVIDALARAKADSNRARGHAEAERAIVVDNRMAEVATQRVARWIMRKLDEASGWVSHVDLRRKLKYQDRDYFEDAIEALKLSGQIEERAVKSGQSGIEYRKR